MAQTIAKTHKEWEKPLTELEDTIGKLREAARKEADLDKRAGYEEKADRYQEQAAKYVELMYANLGDWENVLVARAEKRPYTLDYIGAIFSQFTELQGDRNGFVDHAIIGGPALLDGRPVMVVGHQKGRNIQERQMRNFGMARPEGYRKAIRLFEMADRFRLPVISFVDTPAADPGVESESRGISEAIAASMLAMFELRVPTVAIVIGEGGSGGAIGIAVSNRVLMQKHAVYSVIPPEGCAAILWRAPERAPDAAKALQITSESALRLGVIDEIVPEPIGAAHRNPAQAAEFVKAAIVRHLAELDTMSPADLQAERQRKFRAMGQFGS
ncbi:MAG: acetyl-CoA carboxylase carboxyltransferase subunit alpha [Fimbriimonadaceae bacterium]|nr:acetyl-CoA carboxylase carboxyltransferase subunit alpha [Fimbriimonadaceae bacterium]